MQEIIERIRLKRTEKNMSYAQLAKLTGISKSTLQRYETGAIGSIALDKLDVLANALNTTPLELMGWGGDVPEGFASLPVGKRVPIVGSIACGLPILAEENITGYVTVPNVPNVDFCLFCKGDSMINANIHDGDIVYIHRQSIVENGQIAAVRIEDEATIKKVFISKEQIILQPENSNYPPLVYRKEDMNKVVIVGLVVGYSHWFK